MSENNVLVLDGGFSTQLTVHVGDSVDGDPLWSARFNSTNPSAVIQTHLDFLNAGANVILTNTYQASVEGYTRYLNLDEQKSLDLIKATVDLAKVARTQFLNKKPDSKLPLIAASIGPYGAHLHDGSEYTGSYAESVRPENIKEWHRRRIEACLEAGVDLLAIETIPCLIEAEVLVDMLCYEYPDVKFWVSFQCKDDTHLAHGEDFSNACAQVWNKVKENGSRNLVAVGANCIHPSTVTNLFKSVNGNLPKEEYLPLVVYPNSGEKYDVQTGWYGKEDCVPLESYVPEWLNLGVRYIGGCCRTGDKDIENIRKAVENFNSKKQ